PGSGAGSPQGWVRRGDGVDARAAQGARAAAYARGGRDRVRRGVGQAAGAAGRPGSVAGDESKGGERGGAGRGVPEGLAGGASKYRVNRARVFVQWPRIRRTTATTNRRSSRGRSPSAPPANIGSITARPPRLAPTLGQAVEVGVLALDERARRELHIGRGDRLRAIGTMCSTISRPRRRRRRVLAGACTARREARRRARVGGLGPNPARLATHGAISRAAQGLLGVVAREGGTCSR